MPIVPLEILKSALPDGCRIMGIDHGSKTWGLAISNPEMTIATPLQTIHRTKFKQDIKTLAKICRDYRIAGFIIGLPLNMDGTEGARVDSVKHFGENLLQARDILGFEPLISFWDERLSTFIMDDFLRQHADISREKRDEVIDKLAAAHILQGAIDSVK